ncbi:MAG: polysaccharide deacetylase family protein [Erysipelotrichaceae bacterium]|nr:polysaccharide deacetylase family protein [Erysipelotrichaceae bacterium]
MKLLLFCALFLLQGCFFDNSSTVAHITDDIPEMTIIDGNLNPENYSDLSAQKIAWGLGPSVNELQQPIDSLQAIEKFSHLNTLFLVSDENEILLTFDNGYENGNTPVILDTLKKHDVNAVFFITSQYAIENPDLVQRMIDEGHVIGNHSWHHKSFPELSIETLTDEILSLHNYMIEHHQYEMRLLRPPMGEFSERSLAVAKDLGYTTMMWSYAYYDYNVNDQPSHAEALDKLISHLHPGEILLLHAVSSTNMDILDEFIDQTLNKGIRFTNPSNYHNHQ